MFVSFEEWYKNFYLSDYFKQLAQNPVAYFCMEYALPKDLPIYAGGLGVLAGDYILEAGRQNFPMVAVGLFYAEHCQINLDNEVCLKNEPQGLGLKPVKDKLGNRIKVVVPVGDHQVAIQAWLYSNANIPVYLLDTNIPENDPEARLITNLLYSVDIENRIKQEMVLGIGGVRFLEVLGIKPSIYHMNEGHSAFLFFEVAKMLASNPADLPRAFLKAREKIVFTNHTLVVGGRDIFDPALVARLFSNYASEIGLDIEEIVSRGQETFAVPASEKSAVLNKSGFGTTTLAIQSSRISNAVSALHTKETGTIWPNAKMISITNGINLFRWDKIGTGQDVIEKHKENKKILLDYIKKTTNLHWQENDLILGWARRITAYKRPLSFFDNMTKAKSILTDSKKPVRLIISGKPHYADVEGRDIQNRLRVLAQKEFRHNFVFLEDYNTGLSEIMIPGCDIWLNTPIAGLEACGTSGMKASLNGTLIASVNDGWLPEIDLPQIGFILDNDLSNRLLPTIEQQIMPQFFCQDKTAWNQKMIKGRQTIIGQFGTDRMLKDYIEQIYKIP